MLNVQRGRRRQEVGRGSLEMLPSIGIRYVVLFFVRDDRMMKC